MDNSKLQNKYLAPPPVGPGSLFRMVSPAGKFDRKPLEALTSWLINEGYRVDWGKHVLGNCYQYSGTDEERLADLQEALDDPEVEVIFSSRGGYGTIRLLENLDFTRFKTHPKWLVGFSDITLLHSALHKLGYQSIEAIMARNSLNEKGEPTECLITLMEILRGEKKSITWKGHSLNRPGKVTAPLTGGNLSLLYSLIGTPFDCDYTGKILFIEDINEYLYHLDRMLVSMRLAGKLEKLAGLVAGYFSEIKDNEDPFGKSVEEIILDAVRGYDFPVALGFPAGHEQPHHPLVSGATYSLESGMEVSFMIQKQSGVRSV